MKYILHLFFILAVFSCKAQPSGKYSTTNSKAIKHYEKATKFYDSKDNKNALIELQSAIEKDPYFVEAYTMMGYVYSDMKDYDKAIEALKRSVGINPNYYRMTWFTLGRLELGQGKYEDAKADLQEYLKSSRIDPYTQGLTEQDIRNCDFAIDAMKHPVDFNPVNVGPEINSDGYEYFPSITADDQTFLFTRNFRPDKDDPNSHMQEDLYISKKVDGKWTSAKSIGAMINTMANEGAPCLSADGQLMFFVACAEENGYGEGRKGYGSCDIFYCVKQGDKWSKPYNLGAPVNTAGWETQPSFSSDGRTLYYIHGAVDEKGVRDDDIYMSVLQDDGRWSKPVRLSDKINTKGREESVFIHPDNQTLYFASDGHTGMGGTDIYMSRRQPDGTWGDPVNLGYPINTWNDENSLLVNAAGDLAYFSSDRKGGSGGMDIYSFPLDKKLQPQKVTYMKGKVFDDATKAPLGAIFELIDLETGKRAIISSSNPGNGEFLVSLPVNKNYALNVSADGYLFYSKNFSLKEMPDNKPFLMDVPMVKPEVDKVVVLDNVFFETGKYDLKPESKTELDKLVDFLTKNPTLKIEIRGHTDNVGKPSDNLVLSDNRAKSVYQYLVSSGIAKERLTFKGYGETKPIADNNTPEGRQKNRRTEFRIVGK
jgi:outer membrane protein OmpA-like peptidoglycan-associated protein